MATRGGGVYFPVDAGFCDTMVARMIVRRLGAEGFVAYVRMLCCLLNEPGGRLPLAMDDEWEVLSERLGLPLATTRELVGLMEHYGALERPDGGSYVMSPQVSAALSAREEIVEKRRAAGRASGEARRKKAAGEQ